MTHPLLDSFDPFATHPFTNNSGIAPQPPQPSRYPIPIPSPRSRSHFPPTYAHSPTTSASPSSPPSVQSTPPKMAPQPRRSGLVSPQPPPSARPIFVPFRQETSSPDLVLRKKASSKNDMTPDPQTHKA